MALYACKIGTEQGEVISRSIVAESMEEVRHDIENKGLFLLSIKKNWLYALFSPRALFSRRLNEQRFLVFNQQFAALLRSGLPVLRALDVIVDKMKEDFFKETLNDIREKIKAGRSLSEAFQEKKQLFPPVYAASLFAGERSGNMDAVLRRFMTYQQQMLTARRKIRSAMIYPAVLFLLSMVLATIMTVFVIPKFAATFAENDATLPAITTFLLSTATFIRKEILFIAAISLIVIFLVWSWARSESGRLTIDRWKFRIPIIGRIWHEFSISQYARTFSTLISGGIPVVDSMDISAGAMGNTYMSREILHSIRLVREGETVSAALQSTNIFPSMSLEMIQVGETTGSLDSLLAELAAFYDEQVETRLAALLSMLEPIVLVVMGVIIATLLLSIYLPLFSMSQVYH